ncbi:MAG: glycoside hydrolase family 15 [Candidatus Woesearchaeota archaeon]|nr:MAG: glycoside hydrolase family 15 [Candidatus Woesearchaeota archaeon]
MPLKYQRLIRQHLSILKNLQYESGLFAASRKNTRTGYNKSWLRDNFYECLAFQILEDWDTVFKTYRAILKIFEKHEYKIDYAIMKKPEHRHEYIHSRYHPHTFDEYWEDWGNKQNDSVGAILFAIGTLMQNKKKILKTKKDYRIVQKLVDYLSTLEYWHDQDSGMWEEGEEVHSSSIGACIAGLKAVRGIKGIHVDKELIKKGEKALRNQLPRESKKKFVDLALLCLIWPYEVTSKKETETILKNVTYHLERNKGIIRYKNDHYYNKNPDGYSEEAEWTFGFSWLAIIYDKLGKPRLAKKYEKLALSTATSKGIPELYFSQTDKYNRNTPLGWAESLFIIALYDINSKHKIKEIGKKLIKK